MSNNPTILITRPEPRASAFAERCRAAAWADRCSIVVAPLMRTRMFGDPIDGNAYDLAVFTSVAGVTAAARLWTGPKMAAIAGGTSTGAAATRAGWETEVADGNGYAVLECLIRDRSSGAVIWPRGTHGTPHFVAGLARTGRKVESVVVYEQIAIPMPEIGRSVLRSTGLVIAPVFSERSAQLLSDAATDASAEITIVAISSAAAKSFLGATHVSIAVNPSATAMLATIGDNIARLAP